MGSGRSFVGLFPPTKSFDWFGTLSHIFPVKGNLATELNPMITFIFLNLESESESLVKAKTKCLFYEACVPISNPVATMLYQYNF